MQSESLTVIEPARKYLSKLSFAESRWCISILTAPPGSE